jgi:hypothetical protein
MGVGVVVGVGVGVEVEVWGIVLVGVGIEGDNPGRLQACTVSNKTNNGMQSFFMEKTIPARMRGVKAGGGEINIQRVMVITHRRSDLDLLSMEKAEKFEIVMNWLTGMRKMVVLSLSAEHKMDELIKPYPILHNRTGSTRMIIKWSVDKCYG